MGKISGENADFTVITSDNPRYEDPMAIIYEIEKGIIPVSKNYVLVSEREEAIKYAINYAKKGDVVLVCGKGCEKYQEKLGIKRLYNDKDTIMNVIGGKVKFRFDVFCRACGYTRFKKIESGTAYFKIRRNT